MLRRALVWVTATLMLLATGPLQGAERPLAETIRAAAAAVRPAVVGIEVRERRGGQQGRVPDWPFRLPRRPGEPRQWRWEFQWPPREGQPRIFPFDEENLPFPAGLRRQPDAGTGIIVAVDGDRGIVAAPHALVADAQTVFVKLGDGRQLAAKLLGADETTGIGCLEIRDPKLAAAKAAKPDAAQVGDWVVAVGGPGADDAVTVGIISTARRPGEGELVGVQVLRADVTVAEGMEGGPLVNLAGDLVGMLLAPGRPGPRQARELATVLPADTLHGTAQALAKEGRVRRGWLGVMLNPLEPEALRQLGIESGIQVAQTLDGQPAAKAGIEAGDVLVRLDGQKITDVQTFRAMVMAKRPGTKVALTLLRGGKEMVVNVTLGEQEGGGEGGGPAAPEGGEKLELGLTLQPLTPDIAAQLGYEGDRGLLVTDVAPDSPAARARPNPIARGELVKEIARKPVATLAEAKAAIAEARKAREKTLLVLVRGKEGARYAVVDLPQ